MIAELALALASLALLLELVAVVVLVVVGRQVQGMRKGFQQAARTAAVVRGPLPSTKGGGGAARFD